MDDARVCLSADVKIAANILLRENCVVYDDGGYFCAQK